MSRSVAITLYLVIGFFFWIGLTTKMEDAQVLGCRSHPDYVLVIDAVIWPVTLPFYAASPLSVSRIHMTCPLIFPR